MKRKFNIKKMALGGDLDNKNKKQSTVTTPFIDDFVRVNNSLLSNNNFRLNDLLAKLQKTKTIANSLSKIPNKLNFVGSRILNSSSLFTIPIEILKMAVKTEESFFNDRIESYKKEMYPMEYKFKDQFTEFPIDNNTITALKQAAKNDYKNYLKSKKEN